MARRYYGRGAARALGSYTPRMISATWWCAAPLALLVGCAHAPTPTPTVPVVDPATSAIAAVRARFQAAIEARDEAAMRALMLAPDVPFRARRVGTGALFASTAAAFAHDVGTATTAWREEFDHEVITVRDGLAVLDADYRFVEDDRVTNHGREIWTLLDTPDGWKITSVTWSVIVD